MGLGAVFVTIFSFVLGLLVCGVWSSLNNLGVVGLPPSGSLDGVLGLFVCLGAGAGITLEIVFA